MAEELKPCPFCGKADDADNPMQESALNVILFKSPAGGSAHRVECVCGASSESHRDRSNAIAVWNTRAAPATPAAPVDDREPTCEETVAFERVDSLGLTTNLTPAALVAGCRAMHACEGSGEADALMHRASQKSWEEPTLPRWAQWVETVVEVHAALSTPPAEKGR